MKAINIARVSTEAQREAGTLLPAQLANRACELFVDSEVEERRQLSSCFRTLG